MQVETSREDPRHIFLEPECCADPSVGRCWAAHNEWPLGDCDVQAEATQYVRADLVAALERERDAATARAEAAERERDALRDEWEEIAAGITTEQPEVGALWPMVSEELGNLAAVRNLFKNEIAAHNRTKAERDAGAAMRRDALFFMADEVADLADGGVAGSALLTAVKRIEAGERMPPEGSEEDWPMLRAVLNQMDDAIRARGPTSALTAALTQARRETWEKAAEIVHGAYLLWACRSSYEADDKASALSDAEAAIRSAAAGEEGKP